MFNSAKDYYSLSSVPLKVLRHYWWVVLFSASVFGVYTHAIADKQVELEMLHSILQELEQQKVEMIEKKQDLLLHKASRTDPEYIKLLLKKNLGVVETGETKVYFQEQ